MRTRESNKNKSFRTADFFPDDLTDDDRPIREEAEDVFYDDVGDEDDDHEDMAFRDDDDLDDARLGSAADDDVSVLEDLSSQRESRRARRGRVLEAQRAPGDVLPYPADIGSKWTRTYVGPVVRWLRCQDLIPYWLGHKAEYEKVASRMMSAWDSHDLRLPKLSSEKHKAIAETPWLPRSFRQDQQTRFRAWYEDKLAKGALSQPSAALQQSAFETFIPRPSSHLTAILGPYDKMEEYHFVAGQSLPLALDGTPMAETGPGELQPGGWLFDVGGIVLSLGWAPATGTGHQFLSMTVIPFSDQAFYMTPDEAPSDSDLKEGSVQIWRVPVAQDGQGLMTLTSSQPELVSALCFRWGRAVRLQWCPVPLTVPGMVGFLALLTAEGLVRILQVKQPSLQAKSVDAEEIHQALATLEIPKEQGAEITCFTWLNVNRIATGHSDGTVAVWSLVPCRLLQRHPVHASYVIDIMSSYPSHPFIVASMPLGGAATITDLNRPNGEQVYHPNLAVTFQPNLLSWSEHIQGFISIWPTSTPGNNLVAYLAARVFSQARLVLRVEGLPMCLCVGTCHPFALVGASDGSVWLSNTLRKTLSYRMTTQKVKLFQHEYRDPTPSQSRHHHAHDEPARRICRVLHGFRPVINEHPKPQLRDSKAGPSSQKRKRRRKSARVAMEEGDDGSRRTKANEEVENAAPASADLFVREPLSRVTAVAWNPNMEFSWWAVAAMGSGLVRIMDLGVVHKSKDVEGSEEDAVLSARPSESTGEDQEGQSVRYPKVSVDSMLQR